MSGIPTPLPPDVIFTIRGLRIGWRDQLARFVGCARSMYGQGWRNRVPAGGIVATTGWPLRQVASKYTEIRSFCRERGWDMREVERLALDAS